MKRAIPVVVIVIVAAAAVYVLTQRARQAGPADQLRVSGMVEARTTDLGPEINGKISAILVREGDAVKRGQLVAELDTSTWQERVSGAEAQAEQAGSKAAEADSQVAALSASVSASTAGAEAARRAAQENLTKLRNGARPQEIGAADRQMRAAYAAWRAAEAVVAKLKAGSRPNEIEQAKAAYAAASAQVEAAQARLARLKAGSRPQEIGQVKAAAAQARSKTDQARRDWQRLDKLAGEGAVSVQTAETAHTNYETLRDQQTSAEQALSLAVEGVHPDDIREAEAELRKDEAERQQLLYALKLLHEGARVEDKRQAEEESRRLRNVYEATRQQYLLVRAGARREDLLAAADEVARAAAGVAGARAGEQQVQALRRQAEAARAQQQAAQAAEREARTNLGRTHLFSPCDGVIQTKVAEVGETVLPGAPILRIVDLGEVWVTVYVAETAIGRVKVGQKVKVTTDSQPGRAFDAAVEMVSSEAEFTPKYVQTPDERSRLVYAVRVRLDNREWIFKPGMAADAVINLREPAPSAARGP